MPLRRTSPSSQPRSQSARRPALKTSSQARQVKTWSDLLQPADRTKPQRSLQLAGSVTVWRNRARGENGASEGIRTLDIHLGKVTLYQTELRSLPITRGQNYGFPAGMATPFFRKKHGRRAGQPNRPGIASAGGRGPKRTRRQGGGAGCFRRLVGVYRQYPPTQTAWCRRTTQRPGIQTTCGRGGSTQAPGTQTQPPFQV